LFEEFATGVKQKKLDRVCLVMQVSRRSAVACAIYDGPGICRPGGGPLCGSGAAGLNFTETTFLKATFRIGKN